MPDSSSESIHILYVGDTFDPTEMSATTLEGGNELISVETAENASLGLELLDDHVDCVVSEHDLPEMDGIAFLRAVREEFPNLPFILFPDEGSEAVASEAISAGITDYVQRGADGSSFDVLRSRVENAVEQYESTRRAEQRQRELERQNESLEEFASIVSHDLRTPLTVARTRLDLAQEDCESPHLEDVSGAIDRVADLLDSLSTLARTGQTISETTWTDLESVAKDAWQNVETSEMTLVVDGNCEADADPERLQQLFENLFENSIEHADDAVTVTVGSIELVPMTTRTTDNTYQGFYVADDGPGIPEDIRSEVLDWGFTTASEGTGFGLAIVSQIAEAHNWEITVTESHDAGAKFEFSGEGFRQPDTL